MLKTKLPSKYQAVAKDLIFDDEKRGHKYSYKGEPVPSVTNIIDKTMPKPALMFWPVKIAAEYLNGLLEGGKIITAADVQFAKTAHSQIKREAADIGTQAHLWIENHIKGNDQEMPENDKVINAVNAFLKWEDQNNPKYMFSELRLYSPTLNVAGTADIIAKIGGKPWLLDVKSGNGIYDEAYIQTGAYRAILRELDIPTDGITIIRIGKTDGEFQLGEVNKLDLYESRFKLCRDSYFLDQKIKNA